MAFQAHRSGCEALPTCFHPFCLRGRSLNIFFLVANIFFILLLPSLSLFFFIFHLSLFQLFLLGVTKASISPLYPASHLHLFLHFIHEPLLWSSSFLPAWLFHSLDTISGLLIHDCGLKLHLSCVSLYFPLLKGAKAYSWRLEGMVSGQII